MLYKTVADVHNASDDRCLIWEPSVRHNEDRGRVNRTYSKAEHKRRSRGRMVYINRVISILLRNGRSLIERPVR